MAVKSLFLLSVEVILRGGGYKLDIYVQSVCTMLPPLLLKYLLYKAVCLHDLLWVQGLVRCWPLEVLSFDFDDFVDDDSYYGRYEIYLRRRYSWYHSRSHLQMKLDARLVDGITKGLYQRICQSQSIDQATSTKHFVVDLSMMGIEAGETPIEYVLQPLMLLCYGILSCEETNCILPWEDPDCLTSYYSDRVTCTGEKVLIHLSDYWDSMLPFLDTSPCALVPRCVVLGRGNASEVINVLQASENVTSLHCHLETSKSIVDFAKVLAILKEKCSVLNGISIEDFTTDEISNMDVSVPAVPCQRMQLTTSCFKSHFNFVYYPCENLKSLHILGVMVPIHEHIDGDVVHKPKLKFDSEISKIIEHYSESLLDLQMSRVLVAKNSTLLQGTFQKCYSLVSLNISNTNNGSLNCARLHELFCSMKSLLSLTYLSVSETVNVFGKDLCALHNLLYQGLPKLQECCLSFERLVIYFTMLGDANFESIQELLGTLLSGKKPSPDCHTVAFRWRRNKTIHDWLASLRCNVNFCLL